ncbi:MAG: hypothetical protein C0606_00760 [Hyphomicrobiales bacterium]|nr:MAG: hypothetical protein C0606_00760 [Hyphomicrobiales bacterium]
MMGIERPSETRLIVYASSGQRYLLFALSLVLGIVVGFSLFTPANEGLWDFLLSHAVVSPLMLAGFVLAFFGFSLIYRTEIDKDAGEASNEFLMIVSHARQNRPLGKMEKIVLRSRPSLFRTRIEARVDGMSWQLGPDYILFPRHCRLAREIADFAGVPLVDQRGRGIGHSVQAH